MTLLKFVTSGILGTLTVSGFVEKEMNSPDIDTIEPIDTVSIIVPSLNEEKFIKKCLSSIKGQSIIHEFPSDFELILVDSGSKDKTVELAEPYVDKIINVPIRGKLTARNLAIDQANGNIIVSADSDTIYQYFWLNTLLRPFNDIYNPNYNSSTVGVVGSTYDPYIPGIPTPLRNIAEIVDRSILCPNQMVGRNSAFWKHSFYQSGRFDESINQLDASAMIQEEEKGFGNRLAQLGKVIFRLNANCIHLGSERIGCRLGTVDKNVCKSYGINIERFG
jgi:glycosyltransferase involved in cell wall biosynthesis